MEDKENKDFFVEAAEMLTEVKKMLDSKKLRGFAVVICDADRGVVTDYGWLHPGIGISLLGGCSMLDHALICDVQESAQIIAVEKAFQMPPTGGRMN